MADICSCCGKKILLLDVGFDVIEIDGEDFKICSVCNGNFSAYKGGILGLKNFCD